MFDQGINQDFGFDNSIIGNNNVINNDMTVDTDMMGTNNNMITSQQGMMMGNPMSESVQQRVVNRTFVHEVPHVCY